MQKNIICVACPMGCGITVELSDSGEILSVTGNTCKRGDAYARSECTNPVRSLATTVKVDGGIHNVVQGHDHGLHEGGQRRGSQSARQARRYPH